MNATICPEKIFPVPGYPSYSASLDALDVFRVIPAQRGPTAGRSRHRMVPVKHPRGIDWVFQLTAADGTRRRIPLRKLAKLMLDAYGDSCDSTARE